MATQTETLSSYLTKLRRILHDAQDVYWSVAAKTAYINQGMQQRDRDSGMLRARGFVNLTQGTSEYLLTLVHSQTIDVLGIGVYQGNQRLQLSQVAYTDLALTYQSILSYTQWPVAYAKYGHSSLIFAPSPNQNYLSEWDCLLVSNELVNSTDQDPLPYPWTDPVPYMAAHFANLELGKMEEADRFLKIYQERLNGVMAGARGMQVTAPYFSIGSRWP